MATILPEVEHHLAHDAQPTLPDASVLEDRTPEWMRTPKFLLSVVGLFGLTFLFLNYLPLWHTDLWGHLAYGRYISNTGSLPATEPLLPLSTGVRFVDTAWLSQLIGYRLYQWNGPAAIRFLYAGLITASMAVLTWRLYRRTLSIGWSMIGAGVFLSIGWQQLAIVRPQLAGLLGFCALFSMLTAHRRLWHMFAIPALFSLWANGHGSFVVGLAMVACFAVGRVIDIVRTTRSVRAALADGQFHRLLLLLQLSAVGCLVNPYHVRIFAEVITVSRNANLSDLIEWHPLILRMKQGQAMAVTGLALMFLYRLSPRRIAAVEVLLLVGLGAAAMWTSRFINWWAPVAGYYFALHAAAVWRHWRRQSKHGEPAPRAGLWTVVNVALPLILLGLTPLVVAVRSGRQSSLVRVTSQQTPIGAVDYLNQLPTPPQGMLFNSYEWGDFLLWQGRPELNVFLASHAHLVPRVVWDHYLKVIATEAGWDELLDRYGVNTVVIDPKLQATLAGRLKQATDDWNVGYEDERSIVFLRNNPI